MKNLAFLITASFSFFYICAYGNVQLETFDNHPPYKNLHSKYVKNIYVEDALWNELQPYFLPETHPVKEVLDAIFSKERVLFSKKNMKHAGFNILKHPQREIVIARHPNLNGYLIKAYLDNKKIDEWKWWKKRIDGVRQIQECIDRYHFNAIMKTPKKWIYPLPSHPSPPDLPGIWRKNFILIVEDMQLLPKKENIRAYKKNMTAPVLDALFIVLTENLMVDSFFIPNIPFSYDGKIAFIDTEHFNNITRPMKLWKMLRYLSPEMRSHWKKLMPQFNRINYEAPAA